jgi:hypothetical protein
MAEDELKRLKKYLLAQWDELQERMQELRDTMEDEDEEDEDEKKIAKK